MKLPRTLLRAFDTLLLALAISLISCGPPLTPPVLDTEITGGPEPGSITFGGEVGFSCAITSGSGTISPPLYIEASLDGGPYAPLPFGGSDVVYHGLSDGVHTFAARATNGQGQVDPTPATRTWTTDSTPPDTTITAGPSGTVLVNSATFTFSANEATSRFNYALDSEPTGIGNTTSTSLTFSDLAEGQHTLAVEAVDLAGNVDPTPATRTWIVDAIPDGAFGDAFAWGKNQSGQLGDGTTIERPEAVRVTDSGALADKIIVAVAPGEAHNCALTHDGQLFAWGDNQFGQVGDGTTTSRNEPVPVNTSGVLAGKTFTAVAAGRAHNLVLTANGQLFAWGDNADGQLGDGTYANSRSTAVAVITSGVLSGKGVTAVAAGADHSVALTSTGELFAWGNNVWGQLGDGTTAPSRDQPTAVIMSGALAGKTVTAIAAGGNHTLALTSDGQLFAWGNNQFGQLGDGTGFHHLTPMAVVMSGALAGKTVTAIAAGYHHSLALTSDGRVFAWGNNYWGQLGDGTGMDRNEPVAVVTSGFNAQLAGKTVTAIAAGEGHSVVLTSDGELFAWGWNSHGQLGDGGIGSSMYVPGRVVMDGALLGKTVKGVAAGYSHSVAMAFGPEIRVQQPAGTDLTDGVSTVSFGSVFMPGEVERVFTIKNTGYAPLTGLGINIVGDPGFQVTASPTAPVSGPFGSTTFTVRFQVPNPGVHNATLRIASNDPDNNPFDIFLTATALLNSQLLSGLTLSDGTLTPVFHRITNEYTAEVAGTVSSITVTPTTLDSAATVRVNGTPVASGTASGSIPLNFGANFIAVVCTAQDGVTSFTYQITVTRGEIFTPVDVDSPWNPGIPIEVDSGPGLSGTVVYANAEPFVGTLDSDLAGTLRTMVVDRGGGLLDFFYQITNASNAAARGGSDIFRIAVGGYDEGTVEVSVAYTASIAGITGAPADFYTSTPTAGKTVRSADRDPALHDALGVSLVPLCFRDENIEVPFYLRLLYLIEGATQGSCAPAPALPSLNDGPSASEAFTLGGIGFTFDTTGVFNTNYEGPATSAPNNIEVGETSHWLVVRTDRTTLIDVVAHISAGDGMAIVATKAPLGGPDGTPPETTITGGPVGTVSGATAIFTFTGSDNVTPPAGLTFEASLDGAAFTPVVSPKTYTGLSAGPHTFAIRAIDAAGNADLTPATRNWTVGQTGTPCFEVLKIFTGLDGANPIAGLIQDSNGVLYGTAYLGGSAFSPGGSVGHGTVFKINPDGTGFAVIKDFAAATISTTGAWPVAGLMRGTDGALYGAAYQGGAFGYEGGAPGYGTVFKLNPDGTGFTVLKHFDSAISGATSSSELLQGTDGALYGTAALGGSNGDGTLFKLNPDGTGFTVLKHFDSATTGDTPPVGVIQGADSALYGTIGYGGAGGAGTVYKLNPDGSGFTVLKHFDSATTGGIPSAGLIQGVDGALYGTAYEGGSNGYGTVFKLNPDGSGFTVLKHLDSSTTGANPVGELIQGADGALYGTAYLGGNVGEGTVFRLNPDGTDFTVLHHFNHSTISTKPYAKLTQGMDGNLYGTTRYGGDNYSAGTVFRIVLDCASDVTPPETTITTGPSGTVAGTAAIFTFTGSDNVTLPAGLTFEASLDGAAFTPVVSPKTYTGLNAGPHTFAVRAIDAAGNADPTPATRNWTVGQPGTPCLEVLKSFTGLDGANPTAGLIQDNAGALYGTTYQGGAAYDPGNHAGSGTTFKLNPDGTGFTVLKHFVPATTGANPFYALIQATDGALYSATPSGGSNGYGTVYKLNPDGTGFAVIKHFDSSSTGENPSGVLIQGTDGALYGIAAQGGSFGSGTVFKMNLDGTGFIVLKHFDSATTGDALAGGLIQGTGSVLYGTASGGGSFGYGTVFKLNTNGSGFTVLKHFDSSTAGANPFGGVMQGTDGALYGTAYNGGSAGSGTVFKLNPDGTGFTVLKHLDSATTGANSIARLIQGTDGTLYGTAYQGGFAYGTVFKLNPDGTGFVVVKDFDNAPATSHNPYARLMQGADGNLYGTTRFGGTADLGTVFRLILNCNLDGTPPETTITAGPSGTVASAAATFTFTGSDNVTPPAGLTFEASLDGAPFAPAASPLNYNGFTVGSHTVLVRAIDAAGNADPTPATRTWTIDLAPPETTITGGPVGTVSGATAIFTFTGSDNLTPPAGLTFEASLDGAAFTPVVSPKTYTGLSAGPHTVAIRAIDDAGNPDPTTATRTWTVGQTGPPCFEVLKTFTGLDGANPVAGLIQDGTGVLYGTAYLGGSAFQPGNVGYGTVFKLNPDGSGFTVIKDFAASTISTSGALPVAGLMRGTDGALYGAAYQGGAFGYEGGALGYGTVFKLNPDGTGFTVLKHFDSAVTGAYPTGELIQGTDGALYGTAADGGSSGAGTVFKLNPDGTGFAILKHLDFATTGDTPAFGLIQGADGALYGAAAYGGSSGAGTVFKLNPDGTGFTVLKNFDSSTTGGTLNSGVMQGTDGALYGTAYEGGSSGYGTVFKLNTNGSGFTVLKHLDYSTTGANPVGELIQGTDGTLYGTAYLGGNSGDGTVFKLNPDGTGFAVLHHFNPATSSAKPYAKLTQGMDGNLYGTSRYGGDANADGTVFRLVLNCNLDVTPPDTTITSGPSGTVASAAATFTFTGSDDVTPPAGLTFQASLDGAPFAPAASPWNYTGLSEGLHTFTVRAIDAAGNTDPTPATRTWTVAFLPAGRVDSGFNFNLGAKTIFATVVQPDGKIVIGGSITRGVARLNADGSADPSFNPGSGVGGTLYNIVLQPDGKILLSGEFTTVNAQARKRVARLNADGSLENTATFNPGTGLNALVTSMALQADGKIVLGGHFTAVNGQTRNRIVRFNTDGSIDPAFDVGTGANASVQCVAIQADGKILLGGDFTVVNGQPCNRAARLNTDGSLDGAFTPSASTVGIWTMALQADGKILLARTSGTIARLNSNGTADPTFTPGAFPNGLVRSIAVQANGKIVIGGDFTTAGRTRRARLNANGSVESTATFELGGGANDKVYSVGIQQDGMILLGGAFTAMNGQPRNRLARLANDGAMDRLSIPNAARVEWQRGGTSPEVGQVAFELSTNGGTTWTTLGDGARIAGGWERTGLSLPSAGWVRARGRVTSGTHNGSSGLVERVQPFDFVLAPPSMLLAPPLLSPIELWRTQIFGANANNPVIAGDLADPDFDGSPNLLEYAFGTDPLSPNSVPRLIGWPELGSLNFLYQRPVAATDLIYLMEESTDLESWIEAPYSEQILSDDGTTRTMKGTIPFNFYAPLQPQLFLRAKVILAP